MRDISRTTKDREKGGRNTEGKFYIYLGLCSELQNWIFFISVGLKCKMLGMVER